MADTLEQPVGRHSLQEVYALVAEGQSRKAVARVFAELDALLLEGDFSACGWMLAAVDVARLDPTTALAFLTVSLPAHARLPARADLVVRVEAMLQARDPDRAARLLEGLRA